jgi:hypothetical protein
VLLLAALFTLHPLDCHLGELGALAKMVGIQNAAAS